MYYKQADSTEVVNHPELHGGHGIIKRRAFFDGVSRLPVKFQVWSWNRGPVRVVTLTRTMTFWRRSTTFYRVGGPDKTELRTFRWEVLI